MEQTNSRYSDVKSRFTRFGAQKRGLRNSPMALPPCIAKNYFPYSSSYGRYLGDFVEATGITTPTIQQIKGE
jgi:hypothetical protein